MNCEQLHPIVLLSHLFTSFVYIVERFGYDEVCTRDELFVQSCTFTIDNGHFASPFKAKLATKGQLD